MEKILPIFQLSVGKYKWLFLATVISVYIFTAYKSSGFHQPDEHFQVIEFAKYKMGETQANELAWEFNAAIRSTLQPTLCFLLFKALRVLHIDNPYSMAFLLRLISVLFAVYAIHAYVKAQLPKIQLSFHGLFIFLSFFLWIIPYVSARFSSETWSGLFFILGVVQLQHTSRYKFLSVGLLLGIAMLFRYQSAIMAMGLMGWLLWVEKVSLKEIAAICLGILLLMLLGVGIDAWFYGGLTFTAYNYFMVNIVEGVASNFGTSPWYAYLLYILEKLSYPIGALVFLSLTYMTVFRWKEKEVWIIVPFILIHSLIPHKEPRFLFPIVFYSGFVVVCFIQYLYQVSNKNIKKITTLSLIIVLLLNVLGLIVVCNKAAGNGKNAIGEYIDRHYKGEKVNVIYLVGLNAYSDWPFVRNTFYRNEQITLKRTVTIWQDDFIKAIEPNAINLLMISNNDITGPRSVKKIEDLGFQPVFQSIPTIPQFVISWYDPYNNDNLRLYEWQKE